MPFRKISIIEDKKDITNIITVDSHFVFNVMFFELLLALSFLELSVDASNLRIGYVLFQLQGEKLRLIY